MEYIYPKLTSFEQQNLKMEISKTNIPLYIKTRNIRIYVPYSQPNDWTEWAEFFLWTLMGSLGVTKAKNVLIYFFQTFFFFNFVFLLYIFYIYKYI